jgi:hypothetical protein
VKAELGEHDVEDTMVDGQEELGNVKREDGGVKAVVCFQ